MLRCSGGFCTSALPARAGRPRLTLQAVLAHELGHLKCDHGVWLTAANVLAMGTVSLLPVVSSAVEEGLLRWLRAAELTCDRAALLVAQDR